MVYIIKEVKDFPTNPQRGDDLPKMVDHHDVNAQYPALNTVCIC